MSDKTILKRDAAVASPGRAGPAATADDATPKPAAMPRESDHHEWLLDEALQETFPASDPISPAIAAQGK